MNQKTTIGKFALDSLTIGMYENEMVTYREYIQNSTDAIDKAIKLGWLKSTEDANINVTINNSEKIIIIKDNGAGLSMDKAYSKLTDIGNSDKDYSNDRGFRGIGRLAGTAYCEKIVFETSTKGDDKKSLVEWDCKLLKQLLQPGKYKDYNLEKVINECVSVRYDNEDIDKHYFSVTLYGVSDDNDLLNEKKVKEYLAQVAPLEMDATKFYYYSDLNTGIKKFMKDNNIKIEEYPIQVNNERITKLYTTTIKDNNGKIIDEIRGIEKKVLTNNNNQPIAFLWYGDRSICKGQIPDNKIAGIRYRKDNIMVGNENTLCKFFGDGRFNKYFIGELYILDSMIIPNARRDEFEDNDNYKILKDRITEIAKDLTGIARSFSDKNNAYKNIEKDLLEIKKLTNKLETEKLDKQSQEQIQHKIDENTTKIEKNIKKFENSVSKLHELGRTDVNKEDCNKLIISTEGDTTIINKDKNSSNNNSNNTNSNYKNADNNKEKIRESNDRDNGYKENKKKYDPLKGVSRDLVRITRGILSILKEELKDKEYEKLESKIYEYVRKGKR